CVRCIHVSLSLSFVLYSSTTRRAFPSFPTRRSSDLSPEAWWPFQVGIGGSPLHDQRMRDFCREQYKSKHPSVRSLKKLKKTRSRQAAALRQERYGRDGYRTSTARPGPLATNLL